jgi:hypothetical protein
MIAYEILCQSIEDWRAGRRPTAHIPGPGQAPSPYEQVDDSGVVEMDDAEMQVEMEGEAGYADAGYGYGAEAGAPGEPMGPTGTPPAYSAEMPPPYDADQPAPYTEMIPTHEEPEDIELDDDEDDEPPR